MSNNDTTTGPTRRDTLKYGATAAASLGLAGCAGESATESTPGSSGSTATPTAYEVCIEPTGCVEFESVPERWYSLTGPWADMAVALGQVEGATAMLNAPTFYFDAVGVDVPESVVTEWGAATSKEAFYEFDSDVHFVDPNTLLSWTDWTESDVTEIEQNVGPFFGVRLARFQAEYQSAYPRYSLYDGFERAAAVFDERERFEAFERLHEELLADVSDRAPDESQEKEIGLINSGSDAAAGEFYPVTLDGEGAEMEPYQAIAAEDGFAGYTSEWAEVVDYETLLEADPNTIVVHWGIGRTTEEFQTQFVEPMRDHPVGSELTAVQEDRVIPGTYSESGPIGQLFDIELLAKQLYPEEFGSFDSREQFLTDPSEQLFDRQRVADIVNGDV